MAMAMSASSSARDTVSAAAAMFGTQVTAKKAAVATTPAAAVARFTRAVHGCCVNILIGSPVQTGAVSQPRP